MLKTLIQYVIIITVVTLLVWFSLQSLTLPGNASATYNDKWQYLLKTWNSASKGWLTMTAALIMLSHVIRAERWRMLMKSSGHETRTGYNFLSLMAGYLVNLVIPRGGEVSRCYNLYKIDGTPVEVSFGTVVVERIVDLICLLTCIGLAFVIESKKLFSFIDTLPFVSQGSRMVSFIFAGTLALSMLALSFWIVKKNKKINSIVMKLWSGFKEGLLSVFKLKRKGLFVFYSASIWALYFMTSYTIILAFEETRHLEITAVLSIFAIGAIAMAAPLPGGTGSYHVLVPQGLIFLYHIPPAEAVAFTFIFHGWQTAIVIVAGALSLLITSFLVRKKQLKQSNKTR